MQYLPYGDREALEAEIARQPLNVDPHLQLSDWHQEFGDPQEAEFRRLVGESVQRRLQNPWQSPELRPTPWLHELIQPNPHGPIDPYFDYNSDNGRLFRGTPHRGAAETGRWQWLSSRLPLGTEPPDWDVPTEDDLYVSRQDGPYPGRPEDLGNPPVWQMWPAERVYAGIDDFTTSDPALWTLVEQIMRQQHGRGLRFDDGDEPTEYAAPGEIPAHLLDGNGFLISSHPGAVRRTWDLDTLLTLRPRHADGNWVWGTDGEVWVPDAKRMAEHLLSHLGLDPNDPELGIRMSEAEALKSSEGAPVTPDQLWAMTEGALGSPLEQDWRPNEAVPEDHYARTAYAPESEDWSRVRLNLGSAAPNPNGDGAGNGFGAATRSFTDPLLPWPERGEWDDQLPNDWIGYAGPPAAPKPPTPQYPHEIYPDNRPAPKPPKPSSWHPGGRYAPRPGVHESEHSSSGLESTLWRHPVHSPGGWRQDQQPVPLDPDGAPMAESPSPVIGLQQQPHYAPSQTRMQSPEGYDPRRFRPRMEPSPSGTPIDTGPEEVDWHEDLKPPGYEPPDNDYPQPAWEPNPGSQRQTARPANPPHLPQMADEDFYNHLIHQGLQTSGPIYDETQRRLYPQNSPQLPQKPHWTDQGGYHPSWAPGGGTAPNSRNATNSPPGAWDWAKPWKFEGGGNLTHYDFGDTDVTESYADHLGHTGYADFPTRMLTEQPILPRLRRRKRGGEYAYGRDEDAVDYADDHETFVRVDPSRVFGWLRSQQFVESFVPHAGQTGTWFWRPNGTMPHDPQLHGPWEQIPDTVPDLVGPEHLWAFDLPGGEPPPAPEQDWMHGQDVPPEFRYERTEYAAPDYRLPVWDMDDETGDTFGTYLEATKGPGGDWQWQVPQGAERMVFPFAPEDDVGMAGAIAAHIRQEFDPGRMRDPAYFQDWYARHNAEHAFTRTASPVDPHLVWMLTGGAEGVQPPDPSLQDWRPNEAIPEDFYGYERTEYADDINTDDYYRRHPLDTNAMVVAADWNDDNSGDPWESQFLREADPWIRDRLGAGWKPPAVGPDGLISDPAYSFTSPILRWPETSTGWPLTAMHLQPRQHDVAHVPDEHEDPNAWWWGSAPDARLVTDPGAFAEFAGLDPNGPELEWALRAARNRQNGDYLRDLTPVEQAYGGITDLANVNPDEWAQIVNLMRQRKRELGRFEDEDEPTDYDDEAGFRQAIQANPIELTNHGAYADWLRDQERFEDADFRNAVVDSFGRRLNWGPAEPLDAPAGFLDQTDTFGWDDPYQLHTWASQVHRGGRPQEGLWGRILQPQQRWDDRIAPGGGWRWALADQARMDPDQLAEHLRAGNGDYDWDQLEESPPVRGRSYTHLRPEERLVAGIDPLAQLEDDPRLRRHYPEFERLLRGRFDRKQRFEDDEEPTDYGPAEDEESFRQVIDQTPEELTHHGAYADWLEEQDRPDDANFRRALMDWFPIGAHEHQRARPPRADGRREWPDDFGREDRWLINEGNHGPGGFHVGEDTLPEGWDWYYGHHMWPTYRAMEDALRHGYLNRHEVRPGTIPGALADPDDTLPGGELPVELSRYAEQIPWRTEPDQEPPNYAENPRFAPRESPEYRALVARLLTHPGDRVARQALIDHLEESGRAAEASMHRWSLERYPDEDRGEFPYVDAPLARRTVPGGSTNPQADRTDWVEWHPGMEPPEDPPSSYAALPRDGYGHISGVMQPIPDSAFLHGKFGPKQHELHTAYGAAEDEAEFRRRIGTDPLDHIQHAVFSDFLRDQGRDADADFQQGVGASIQRRLGANWRPSTLDPHIWPQVEALMRERFDRGQRLEGDDEPLEYGDLSPQKARTMFHEGVANGHKITDRQRRFFGAVASGEKPHDYSDTYIPQYAGGMDGLRHPLFYPPCDNPEEPLQYDPYGDGVDYGLAGEEPTPYGTYEDLMQALRGSPQELSLRHAMADYLEEEASGTETELSKFLKTHTGPLWHHPELGLGYPGLSAFTVGSAGSRGGYPRWGTAEYLTGLTKDKRLTWRKNRGPWDVTSGRGVTGPMEERARQRAAFENSVYVPRLRQNDLFGEQLALDEEPVDYGLADDEAGFRQKIEENPYEISNHLAFADWLEEQGQSDNAQFRKNLAQWIGSRRPEGMRNPGDVAWSASEFGEFPTGVEMENIPAWAFDAGDPTTTRRLPGMLGYVPADPVQSSTIWDASRPEGNPYLEWQTYPNMEDALYIAWLRGRGANFSRYELTPGAHSAYFRAPTGTEYVMPTTYTDDATVQSLLAQLASAEHTAHRWGHDDALQGFRGIVADALDDVGRDREARLLRTQGRHVLVTPEGVRPGRSRVGSYTEPGLLRDLFRFDFGDGSGWERMTSGELVPYYPNERMAEFRPEDFGPEWDITELVAPGHVRMVQTTDGDYHTFDDVPQWELRDYMLSHISGAFEDWIDAHEFPEDSDEEFAEVDRRIGELRNAPFEEEDPDAQW